MTFEIRSDIPVPRITGRGRPRKYPFHVLKVGQCFDAPLDYYGSVRNLCVKYGKQLRRQFTSRTYRDENIVRVWRVA